jgi:hypothetical protein
VVIFRSQKGPQAKTFGKHCTGDRFWAFQIAAYALVAVSVSDAVVICCSNEDGVK